MQILILQLKRLGDVVLTTPLVAALREHFPDSRITLALDPSAGQLAPLLDADQILFARRGGFWKSIAFSKFEVVFDVTGNDRAALASFLSRAGKRITWQRFAKKPLRHLAYTTFVESSVKTRHTVDHHTDLLRALGIETDSVPGRIRIPPAADAAASLALEKAGIRTTFAIVHPGTARPEKYWLPERWGKVIERLPMPVIVTGGNDPAERAHIEAIRRSTDSAFVDFAGKLDLPVTAALLARARIVCAVDSLPVHLADAAGTPIVALFGPTNPFHWSPRRSTARIVTASGAEPILPAHPKGPMSDIQERAVIKAIESLLNSPEQTPSSPSRHIP